MLKITKTPKATAKPVMASESVKHPDGSETDNQSVQGMAVGLVDPCNVNVSIGMTINLGNYENVKFMVSLTHPCENNPDAIEEAYVFAKGWVEKRVDEMHTEMKGQLE